MTKDDLIKKPNIKEIKELAEKYNIFEFDGVYLINAEMYNEWYAKNKNRQTMGGKVHTYDLAGAIEIFADEIKYYTENY